MGEKGEEALCEREGLGEMNTERRRVGVKCVRVTEQERKWLETDWIS